MRLCRECLATLRRDAVYCSARCASLDFQRHREAVHLPARDATQRDVDADSLVHESGGRYRADDINRFLWTAQEAMDRADKEEMSDKSFEWLAKK